ncbi:MAG: hydrogenase maturation protease [Candidatus Thiodiazotropha endolucinida]
MTRVLGVGSPFGADRLAWLAIDHLAGLGWKDCELVKLDRPGSRLVSYFHDVEQVVIIDAVRLSDQPGSVVAIDLERLQQLDYPTSSHGFGVAEAVALARQLGELPPRLHVLGIQTGDDVKQLPAVELQVLANLVSGYLDPTSCQGRLD